MAIASPIVPNPSQAVAAARVALAEALVLKVGQVLDAVVVGKTPEGLTALKIGDQVVTAKLPQLSLGAGSTVQLQVKVAGTAPQLQLLNLPPATAATPQTVIARPPVAVPAPAPGVALQGVPEPVVGAERSVPVSSPPQSLAPALSAVKAESQQGLAAPRSQTESAPGPTSVPASADAEGEVAVPAGQSAVPAARAPEVPSAPKAATGQPATIAPQATPPAAVQASPEPVVVAIAARPSSAPVVPAPDTAPNAPAVTPQPSAPPASASQPVPADAARQPTPLPAATAIAAASPDAAEPPAPNPLLIAQAVARPPASPADLPRTVVVSSPLPQPATVQAPPLPATPQAALAQMLPEALSRQDSAGPLLVSLAAAVQKAAVLPEPILRAALGVLAQRIVVSDGKVQATQIEQAVARSGVTLEASLLNASPQPRDAKAGLLALREALGKWLGGEAPPAVSGREPAPPPIKGLPLRAVPTDPPPLPDSARDIGRLLHGETDAAVSRLKLMQLASLPDTSDPGKPNAPTLRMELPFVIGHELVMAQIQVGRDGSRREAERKRGWTMRFALNFSATGEVGAEVGVLGKAVNVALWAAEPETAVAMNETLPDLARALEAVGLKPGAIRIRQGAPNEPTRPAAGRLLDSVS